MPNAVAEVSESKTKVSLFPRLVLREYVRKENTVHMKCRNTCDDMINFILIGKEQTVEFVKKFEIGDSVNIVSEGGVVLRMSKGVDVEV